MAALNLKDFYTYKITINFLTYIFLKEKVDP